MDEMVDEASTATCQTLDVLDHTAGLLDLLFTVYSSPDLLVDILNLQKDSEFIERKVAAVLLRELLKASTLFIERGVRSESLVRSFRVAANLAVKKITDISFSYQNSQEKKLVLVKCASSALPSQFNGAEKEFFASMVVDAVTTSCSPDELSLINIKRVPGGTIFDTFVVNGIAFKATFWCAGFMHQISNPKILIVIVELESNPADIRHSDPLEIQTGGIRYDKLEKCALSGANIILSCFPFSDAAVKFFIGKDIFCVGQVTKEDLQQVAATSGAIMHDSLDNIKEEVLGTCELFEVKQVGSEWFNIFSGCPVDAAKTIVLRGTDQYADGSFNDSVMILTRVIKNPDFVAGGGATDMEISRCLMTHAETTVGKSRQFIEAYAKAVKAIPKQLFDDAGMDSESLLFQLKDKSSLFGVNIMTGCIVNAYENFIWEPAFLKTNAISSATEAACLVLGDANGNQFGRNMRRKCLGT
ncbi:hypothetical protein MKW94_025158 [Papaver nudicaule]|uniref:CCT-eta n=1 Tax=Papaver nudicaule TaxID=74823 RepID=A0AA41V1A0_PAPNU|nr:hypothetical protein [Papaver nudicaule]